MNPVTHVVAYARFSTEMQAESSIEDQLRVCREYAAARGWTIAAEFGDRGISGAALGNRPGAQAAIAAARDVLLVNDLSRLSRSQDLAPLLSRLRHRGVRVLGVQDGYDSDSRTARMQAGLSGIMSEEFRAMIADRTRSALQMRAKDGRPTGGKAYGDPAVVREIFERFAAGETMRAIASDLNGRGVPSPGSSWKPRSRARGNWVVSALHSLLQNERYIGRVIWNRSQWVKHPDKGIRERRERPESEWIETACEPLVDAATWARVQARFTSHPGRGAKPRYILSGLLECAQCGSKLIVVGGSQRRYICGTFHAAGAHGCANRATFPRLVGETMILAHVREQMLSPAAVAEGVKMLREERASAEKPGPAVDREVAELERLVREGVLSTEVAAPALAEARRRARARESAPLDLPWPSEKAWRETVANMLEVLQGEDVLAAREVLRGLLGPVRCAPDGAYVVAKFAEREVLMTGSGRSVDRLVAGACYSIRIPTSTSPNKRGV